MKLKLKNSELYINNGVQESGLLIALVELDSLKTPAIIQYNCYKSLQECRKEASILEEARKRILTGPALKNEKGQPTIVDNQYQYETVEVKQEVINSINDLYNLEVEIEISQLPIQEALSMKEPMPGGLLGKLIGKFFIE